MKMIKFIGDPKSDPPGEGPETIHFYGLACPKGKAVKCDNPQIIAKAEGSSHFEVTRKGKGHGPDGE